MSLTVIETVAGADVPNASATVKVKLSSPTNPAAAVYVRFGGGAGQRAVLGMRGDRVGERVAVGIRRR